MIHDARTCDELDGEKSGTPTDLIFCRPCGISTNSRVPSPTGLRQRQDCHANSAEAHAVVAAVIGFTIWYLADRGLIRTADRCP